MASGRFMEDSGLAERLSRGILATASAAGRPQTELLRELFSRFLRVTMAICGAYLLVAYAIDPEPTRVIISASVLFSSVLCHVILRSGRIRAAFAIYAWSIFVAIVVQSAIRGGLYTPSLPATILLFLMGGWLLGGHQAFFLWLAAVVWMGILALNTQFKWWEPLPTASPFRHFLALAAVWTASFFVARLMLNSYRGQVQHIQELDGVLTEKLQALDRQRDANRLSEQKILQIMTASPLPITVANFQSGVYVDVNRAWESTFQFSKSEVLGKTSVDLGFWKDMGERQGWIDHFSIEGRISGYEATFRMRGGGERTFLLSSERFIYGDEECVLTMSMDVTERKKLESELKELNAHLELRVAERTAALNDSNQHLSETMATLTRAQNELVQSEKLASLGSLVAGVAHELNTPLGNALLSATTMTTEIRKLEREVAADGLKKSTFDAFVNQMKFGADLTHRSLLRSVELISGFKQVAVDLESERRRTFDLADTLNDLLATLMPSIKRSNISLELQCPQGIVMESFPGPLGQVVINLVNNAIAHAFEDRDSGNIKICANYEVGESTIKLTVSDDGIGIPEELISDIFDPFFTTKLGRGGSGLGLSISRRIVVKVLGGSLRAFSKRGAGAQFELVMPLFAPQLIN